MARASGALLVSLAVVATLQLCTAYTHPDELARLIKFRNEFRKKGPHWKGAMENWECPAGELPGQCDPCGDDWWGHWDHISCRNISKLFRDDTVPGDGYVTNIHFSLTGTEGPPYEEVAWFPHLKEWDHKVCALAGSLPDWVPDKLPKLEEWDFSRNLIVGTIPESSGDISLLVRFKMQSNRIKGTLPESWSKLSKLEWIRLFDNDLTGTIPASYSKIAPRLTQVGIGGNELEGTLYPLAQARAQNANVSSLPFMCGMIPEGLQFAYAFDVGGSPHLGLPCPGELENGMGDPADL